KVSIVCPRSFGRKLVESVWSNFFRKLRFNKRAVLPLLAKTLWRGFDVDKYLIALKATHFDTHQHASSIRNVVGEPYTYLGHRVEVRNVADVFNSQRIDSLL